MNIEDFYNQAELINENLKQINQSINSDSFFNSNLFSAIIGSGATIFVLFLSWLIKKIKKFKEDSFKECMLVAKNYFILSPESLSEEASYTQYGDGGHTLQQKMIIGIRKNFKYRLFKDKKLKNLFAFYEKKIQNSIVEKNTSNLNVIKNIEILNQFYEKIKKYVFDKVRENEHTINY